MRLWPQSNGEAPAVFREFNPCHDNVGRFCSGESALGATSVLDPRRARSVHGQDYDLSDVEQRVEGLDPHEAHRLEIFIAKNYDAAGLKDTVAHDLGDALEAAVPAEALEAFVDQHGDDFGADGGDEDGEPDWSALQEDNQDAYDEYTQGVADEAQQEQVNEYETRWDESRENLVEVVASLESAWEEAREGVPDASAGGILPGFEAETLSNIGDTTPTAEEVAEFLETYQQFKDRGNGSSVEDQSDGSLAAAKMSLDAEDYAAFVGTLASWKSLPPASDIVQATLEQTDYDGNEALGSKFEKWRDNLDSDYENADSFETWYVNNYGDPPGTSSGSGDSGYTDAQKVANFLVGKWASTSGDHDDVAIAMQLAANAEFQLSASNTARYTGDEHDRRATVRAQRVYETDGVVMRGFLRAMYDSTQKSLAAQGYGEDAYVTLFRGMGISGGDEMTNLPERGAIVDVRLQPVSSFSASAGTAIGFADSSHSGALGALVAMRVPRKQILSTPLSGYGCLNEKEVTVLGGRYPAWIGRAGYTRGRVGAQNVGALLKDAIVRWRAHTGRPAGNILGPGDAG